MLLFWGVFAFLGGVFVLLVFFCFFSRASAIFFCFWVVIFLGGTTPKRGIPALLARFWRKKIGVRAPVGQGPPGPDPLGFGLDGRLLLARRGRVYV